MKLVELHSVRHCYGKLEALHDLNLSLNEGEVLGLFGHNGAGKTTTMKLILGLLRPTSGQVCVSGASPEHVGVRQQLGYLPENVSFYPQLTGLETLRYFARLKSAPSAQVEALLRQVGLTEACQRKVKTYSKGMRQRLGLAQALLGKPRLLLLDEPTVGLDPIATRELYAIIQQLREGGTAVILCSHVLAGVEAFIDRAAIMAAGRLQADGTLSELRSQVGLPSLIRVNGLLQARRWQAQLSGEGFNARLVGEDNLEVATHNGAKQQVLKILLEQGDAEDIEVRQANMEEIYSHFMTQPSAHRSAP
ncbi:ABC transporter ATP-binding protein [Bowmanella pacifica]|uniref:Copper ABC transporter ATP-binding protein n=2 Tax=Bowmanella TaxID=366580 RepID=A0A917YZG3_9ALTE|nr:ABC transporter ATP-binding protein [Bowmanella pacifica]GGO70552.1 copper ABC transporter ATP-binding protein [Bowmanella pacifica]